MKSCWINWYFYEGALLNMAQMLLQELRDYYSCCIAGLNRDTDKQLAVMTAVRSMFYMACDMVDADPRAVISVCKALERRRRITGEDLCFGWLQRRQVSDLFKKGDP